MQLAGETSFFIYKKSQSEGKMNRVFDTVKINRWSDHQSCAKHSNQLENMENINIPFEVHEAIKGGFDDSWRAKNYDENWSNSFIVLHCYCNMTFSINFKTESASSFVSCLSSSDC